MIDTTALKKQLADIDELATSGSITEAKAELWKARVIADFEAVCVPKERRQELPNDLAHLPGRLVGGFIEGLGAFARGCGATYEGLSKQEGYLDDKGKQSQKKQKTVVELYNDLPPEYK